MRVVVGAEPALVFERPRRVVRAASPAAMAAAFDEVEAALQGGAWAAGYVAYDDGEGDVAAIGIFDEPRAIELPIGASSHSPLLPLVERDAYVAGVAALQRAIYDGDVYQVNYTVPFALATQGDPFALYARYARTTGASYQAYVEDGERALLSWSPELFLAFDGGWVRTKPMKGTAPLDRVEDLASPKNRAEHVMIVDLLRNDLHRICDEVRVESFLDVERYPTLATMTSTIQGRLRADASLSEIFGATFPCGSITGAPKRAAMRFIAETERSRRGSYCGSIGFLSPERRGWWNVAIRTAQIDRTTGIGRYDAGGGIVADSDASAEWQETLLKGRFLRPHEFAILETFAADAGARTVDAHLARLRATAVRFGVEPRLDAAAFEGAGTMVRLRLALDGSIERLDEPLEPAAEPVPVGFSRARVRAGDPFLRYKTTWRPAHDRAAEEAAARGWFDALLLNDRGELTEGWRTNLFFECDGQLWTPPLECGVLPGILRARLVSEGHARERAVTPETLRRASAIYAGNSARGLLRAVLIEDEK